MGSERVGGSLEVVPGLITVGLLFNLSLLLKKVKLGVAI